VESVVAELSLIGCKYAGEKQEWIEKFSQKSSKGWTNLPILEDIV
jgi:hypothetical protein